MCPLCEILKLQDELKVNKAYWPWLWIRASAAKFAGVWIKVKIFIIGKLKLSKNAIVSSAHISERWLCFLTVVYKISLKQILYFPTFWLSVFGRKHGEMDLCQLYDNNSVQCTRLPSQVDEAIILSLQVVKNSFARKTCTRIYNLKYEKKGLNLVKVGSGKSISYI